jgi:hypothetical protein
VIRYACAAHTHAKEQDHFCELEMFELDEILSTAIALGDASSSFASDAWRGDVAVTYKADGSSLTRANLPAITARATVRNN